MSTSKMDISAAEESAELPLAIGVGIDFVTTYSSVVFYHPKEERLISIQYPNRLPYAEHGQAPSVVAIPDNGGARNVGSAQGSSEDPNWGFSALAAKGPIALFKLGLIDRKYMPDRFRKSPSVEATQHMWRDYRVTAEDATQSFLEELWAFSLNYAASELNMDVGQLRAAPLPVAMGVPANWPHDAMRGLQEAARGAGIFGPDTQATFSFLSEPEANLINFIARKAISTDFKAGDIIGICDVGGGTIDTGAYMCEASTSAATPMFRECVAGDSQLAGTVLLDDSFFELVKEKFEERSTPAVKKKITTGGITKEFGMEWESNIKKHFNGTNEYSIRVPTSLMSIKDSDWSRQNPADSLCITLTQEDLRKTFDPAVDDVLRSIHDQTNAVVAAWGKLPKLLVLCGGFSENPYPYSRVKECVEVLNQNQPQLVQGRTQVQRATFDRVLAVAGGCAYHALDLHGFHVYGTASITSFTSEDSYFLTRDDKNTNIEKFLDKGDHLTLDTPRLVRFKLAAIGIRNGDTDISLAVYRNLAETPKPIISPDQKHCVIHFKPSGVDKVWALPEPCVIHIGITFTLSGELQFLVRVGGEVLLQEVDVVIRDAAGNMMG